MATTTIQPTQTPQPSLPDLSGLRVLDDVLLFKARAKGVQKYPWDSENQTFGPPRPEAILVTDGGDLIHHFKASDGPPTWQAADGSLVVGTVKARADAPAADAIPWLLLTSQAGGTPNGTLSNVSFIQRVYTKHGNAPSVDCDPDDANHETPVFYEAEYYFYVPKDSA